MLASLLPLVLVAAAARAQQAPPCVPLMSIGCYLERPGAATLLVYHRGHLVEPLPGERQIRGGGRIPPELLAVSAQQAVREYDLESAAAALDASLIVTGAYYVGVDVPRYADGRRLLLAAHSGGVEGLAKTLGRPLSIDGLALLDCFYGEDSGGLAAVGGRISQLLSSSPRAVCGGFFTPHNAGRLRRIFLPALGARAGRCRFDARGKGEHNSAVAEELVKAMRSSLLLRGVDPVTLAPGPSEPGAFDARWAPDLRDIFDRR